MAIMIGEVIDHYRVLELVGSGAMGVVYKALDVNLDRLVAIKVMSAEVRSTPDFVERFRQEARLQAALNHPNVALLFDYFIHEGAPIAVMEFIEGESLEQMIRRRGAIPAHEGIPLFKQALRGVAAAHRAGIIHRDLKPSNLMITKDDVVKVMDFGIAKRQGSTGATKASTSIGSPLYMAPEQILGRTIDSRTDVYGLGITLYELLSGQPPFNPRGKAEFVVLNAHVNDMPEPPTVYRYGIPQPIVDAVMRALAKDPAARFQSADEFMRALPEVPAPNSTAQRPAGPTVPPPNADAAAVGPTGTLALGPDAAVSPARPSGTMVPEHSPAPTARLPTGTLVLKNGPSGGAAATPTVWDVGATGTAAATKRSDDPTSPPSAQPLGPTGRLVLQPSACTSKVRPGGTGALERSPPPTTSGPTGTLVLENRQPPDAIASPTVWVVGATGTPVATRPGTNPASSLSAASAVVPELPAGPRSAEPSAKRFRRADRSIVLAALAATLVLGALLRHAHRLHAARDHAPLASAAQVTPMPAVTATPTPTPNSVEPVAPPPAVVAPAEEPAAAPPTDTAAATAVTPQVVAPADRSDSDRQDWQSLSGTWGGEYVDASGKQLLRVVSLSISRVYDDGGIDGTLLYEAASGEGQCQLRPRGSSYSVGAQRLQLSPESCSPHHPKELGVPFDFDGVNPRTDTLKDGRVEAPTGEVIRVRLRRLRGV